MCFRLSKGLARLVLFWTPGLWQDCGSGRIGGMVIWFADEKGYGFRNEAKATSGP